VVGLASRLVCESVSAAFKIQGSFGQCGRVLLDYLSDLDIALENGKCAAEDVDAGVET
jgi:hypothetical protein